MNRISMILTLSAVALYSCGGNSSVSTEKIENKDLPVAAAAPKEVDETPKTTGKANYDLLQGKWQSTDDKTNFLIFEKDHRKEGDWDEVFILANNCTNASNKDGEGPGEKDKYISCEQSDMCWYIVELNATTLSLSYMGRGNTLDYKRVE